jgi:diacylglycerol diphosphate phosphatase / phosphatidate phosphatase
LKKTVGGFRPHFLEICNPDVSALASRHGTGFQQLFFTVGEICRGKEDSRMKNALESFPSGHANIAFAGMGYLSLYLFYKSRNCRHGRHDAGIWRIPVVLAPLLFATYVAMTMVFTRHHHWYEVVVGGAIGASVAVLSYHMVAGTGRRAKKRNKISGKRNGNHVLWITR